MVGDCFDRGTKNKEVFEFMRTMQSQDRLIYILGNHEDLLFDCMAEIAQGWHPGDHHFHNHTVHTIAEFCDVEWYNLLPLSDDKIKLIFDKTEELRCFIREHGLNYFELGNRIFTHSWLPVIDYFDKPILWDKWDIELTDPTEASSYWEKWRKARWPNPYKYWKQGLCPKDKCIVFGHYHVSYGHSYIDMKTKEWPQHNQKEKFEAAFKPWVKENAIGLDACVAYSGKINCVVFDKTGRVINGLLN